MEAKVVTFTHIPLKKIRTDLKHAFPGRETVIDYSLVALLAGSHVLYEGPPGLGKTSIAQAIAKSISGLFHRVQMTSDLLPSDVLGHMRLKPSSMELEFHAGPVFANVILADEFNRANSKTQSALLEAMAEKTVTIDGKSHPLPNPFFLIATQNPFDYAGVFPLSESQLDRFLFHVDFDFLSAADERKILAGHNTSAHLGSTMNAMELFQLQAEVKKVFVEASVQNYLHEIVQATRKHPQIAVGASLRALIQFVDAVRALAFLQGRDFVTPADVQELAPLILGHRMVYQATELKSKDRKEIVRGIMASISSPK